MFFAAQAGFIVLFELGRRRVLMPAFLILQRRRIDPVEISPAGNSGVDRDRIPT